MQRRRCVVLAISSCLSSTLPAQATGVLTGVVRDRLAERALGGAEIAIDRAEPAALSDSAGKFFIAKIPAGRHIVTVRHIGFSLLSTVVDVAPGDTLDGDFALTVAAQPLPEVEIRSRDPLKIKLRGFEQRRSGGFGHFLGPESFAGADARQTSDLLRQIPGTKLIRANNGGATWLAGGRMAMASGNFTVDRADRRRGARDKDCYASIYLDGAPVFGARPNEALFDVNTIPPNTIAAVEFYEESAQAPPEYPQKTGTCGVLLLWTKI